MIVSQCVVCPPLAFLVVHKSIPILLANIRRKKNWKKVEEVLTELEMVNGRYREIAYAGYIIPRALYTFTNWNGKKLVSAAVMWLYYFHCLVYVKTSHMITLALPFDAATYLLISSLHLFNIKHISIWLEIYPYHFILSFFLWRASLTKRQRAFQSLQSHKYDYSYNRIAYIPILGKITVMHWLQTDQTGQ